MAVTNYNKWYGTSNSGDNSTRYLRTVKEEYTAARQQLVSLKDEFGSLGETAAKLIEELDSHYQYIIKTVENAVPFDRCLVSPLPPPIDRSKVRGLIAYRAWKSIIKGRLHPCICSSSEDDWKGEVNFSDIPPTQSNHSGLHATMIEAYRSNSYGEFVTGLVDCYGTVIQHADGVIRAECARVLCIFLTVTEESSYISLISGAYKAFKLFYPNAIVSVVSPFQKELIISREILITQGAI